MILKAIKYTRFEGEPREWKINGKGGSEDNNFAVFSNLNLLVGKNASGKSRTLASIHEISNLISGCHTIENTMYPTEKYEMIFTEKDEEYKYCLSYRNREIEEEWLTLNDKEIMNRSKLTVPPAVSVPVISIPNPDFEKVRKWSLNLKSFMFSNQHEKNHLVKDFKTIEKDNLDVEGTGYVIYTFYKGLEEFGDKFAEDIVKCMKAIGYFISDIEIQKNQKGYGISIEEDGRYKISQREMSHGMFRALTLFIQLIYAQMSNYTVCILLDDIGEGLDYDRSKELIDIVIKKINNSGIQIFMTTNDRNIMNKIPLRYWTIIDRSKEQSVFYNYENSKDVYDDFKYTGLNNFDFLATDFYKKGFGTEDDNTNEIED